MLGVGCKTLSVDMGRSARLGEPWAGGAGVGRLLALVMAAFRTCESVGLMPHARHGGSGVWALAACGSKFTGIGFEKLQMVQTHVAVVIGGGSVGGRYALSLRAGDAESVLDGEAALDKARP